MPYAVRQLFVTQAAIEKLGRRGIAIGEARQLLGNHHVLLRNPHWPGRRVSHPRRLMVGRTNGGRRLTLVVERTVDPSDWLIITGWDSPGHEHEMLRRRYG